MVDAVSNISVDEQRVLMEIVRRRVAEQERERVIADGEEGEREFAEDKCRPMTVEEIMKEVDGEP